MKNLDFYSEGKVCSLHPNIISFLEKRFGITDSKMGYNQAEGIGWNNTSYWYLKNINKSQKPEYSELQILHRITMLQNKIEKHNLTLVL